MDKKTLAGMFLLVSLTNPFLPIKPLKVDIVPETERITKNGLAQVLIFVFFAFFAVRGLPPPPGNGSLTAKNAKRQCFLELSASFDG
jgi:hypothetical protein